MPVYVLQCAFPFSLGVLYSSSQALHILQTRYRITVPCTMPCDFPSRMLAEHLHPRPVEHQRCSSQKSPGAGPRAPPRECALGIRTAPWPLRGGGSARDPSPNANSTEGFVFGCSSVLGDGGLESRCDKGGWLPPSHMALAN